MSRKSITQGSRFVLGAATLVCALLAGTAVARDHTVTVTIHVSTQGLVLGHAGDARTFYTRVENAAWVACTRGDRADLLPVDDTKACYEKALGSAIRSAHERLLTQIYLTTHTLREAAAFGVEVPAELAAK
jgi:UrcA family protein